MLPQADHTKKSQTTTTNPYQMFISLFEHLAMVVALSRWRNVRSKWPPTVVCNGKVPFEEAYNEARWQRKSTAVLILLMFLVCGILENKEARRIQFSTVMFYAVSFISIHVGILLRFYAVQTVELQMFSRCPFGILFSIIMLLACCPSTVRYGIHELLLGGWWALVASFHHPETS